jgi:hypothetical protein
MRYLLFITISIYTSLFALYVSDNDAKIIGDRIWNNECGKKISELTHWKDGENFPSLGIGHFIWYNSGKVEKFEETFPELIVFLKSKKVAVPSWILSAKGCPWSSREEFYLAIDSKEMKELRDLLLETVDLQAKFIVGRLEKVLPKMIAMLDEKDKLLVTSHFFFLAKEANGLYALIDYLNFKGSGTAETERYKGEGWGLLQVLQGIALDSKCPLNDFVGSAKSVLSKRVQNSPKQRDEKRWLTGWNNRLDSYLATQTSKKSNI